MHLEWILSPALQYAVEAVGLGLCLYLFFTLKHEARLLELRGANRQNALEVTVKALEAAIEEMKCGLREVEEQTGMLVAPAPLPSGLNLNKRLQALRMYRRGESPEKIAASLQLPQTEVELLLKVQRIVLEQQ